MAAAGKALSKRIVDDLAARGLEPDAKERELLGLAEGLADQLAGLRRSVAARGYSSTLESGRIVLNPAVTAINSTTTALAKVLDQISMSTLPVKNAKKQHAAAVRWAPHNEAEAKRMGGA